MATKPYPYLLIGFSILVVIVLQIIDFNGLYGQDAHEYLRYTKHLKNSLLNFEKPDNYFWPVIYPLIGLLVSLISFSEMFGLQLISIVAYVITAAYIIKTLNLLYKESSLVYVGLFFYCRHWSFGLALSSCPICFVCAF